MTQHIRRRLPLIAPHDNDYSSNRLAAASSRYLLQRKDDPVHWQPWNQEVLAHAADAGKPVLLSIGYFACQWCRTMARESFADPALAALLNANFVCIKVDREERPDLDQAYQTTHQLLSGQPGAWPLTVFLCPESRLPFLTGTYFPPQPSHGQPGLGDLLVRVSAFYRDQRDDCNKTLRQLEQSLALLSDGFATIDAEAILSDAPIERAARDVLQMADRQHGGFGAAPKFPMPAYLGRLLQVAIGAGKWQSPAREHLHKSLLAMANPGIRDPLDGGFFRYARDTAWHDPHPEKMLCDNGLLLAVYARAWQLLGDDALRAAAAGAARWIMHDMSHPEGAFYASRASGEKGALARDEKIITAWNALGLRGLAIAARVFGNSAYLRAAQRAVDFIRRNLWRNHRLYAIWQDGSARVSAYLDDYVFLMDALLELLQTEWRDEDYYFLGLLAEAACNNFEDREQGGFYFTAHDSEALIFRSKPYPDGALPAGNGVAAQVFQRFGLLSGEPRYLDCARRILLNGWASMLRQPAAHHSLMQALEDYLCPPAQVLIKGASLQVEWQRTLQRDYGSQLLCYCIPPASELHPPEVLGLEEGEAVLCLGDACQDPQDDLAAICAQLDAALSQRG